MTILAKVILWILVTPFLILVVVAHGDDIAHEVHDGFSSLIDTLVDG